MHCRGPSQQQVHLRWLFTHSKGRRRRYQHYCRHRRTRTEHGQRHPDIVATELPVRDRLLHERDQQRVRKYTVRCTLHVHRRLAKQPNQNDRHRGGGRASDSGAPCAEKVVRRYADHINNSRLENAGNIESTKCSAGCCGHWANRGTHESNRLAYWPCFLHHHDDRRDRGERVLRRQRVRHKRRIQWAARYGHGHQRQHVHLRLGQQCCADALRGGRDMGAVDETHSGTHIRAHFGALDRPHGGAHVHTHA